MEYFPLLELPEDLQAMVVERVARNSFQDLYRLRASSRSMKALAEMRRGVQFFYSYDEQDYGLSLIKRAADAGYERAVYTHAMTQAIFYGDAQYFRRIPRATVDRVGKLVRDAKWGWGLWHTDEFRQIKAMFTSTYVPSFYLCQCANVVDRQCLCLWHIDVTKDDNMCERCFWIKEISLFFRDFEPISLFRDTSKW
ncbi:unnamed protein product [Brassica rapa]|uniref:F-box domain-containing protein n=4 Tax=Brassica TaxID=3705 RepID=A0A8D9HN69_BRACM|nr:unnamed protein product [Brassica napus]CAG7900741.1 unnamed protein product [Brassica rapa]